MHKIHIDNGFFKTSNYLYKLPCGAMAQFSYFIFKMYWYFDYFYYPLVINQQFLTEAIKKHKVKHSNLNHDQDQARTLKICQQTN